MLASVEARTAVVMERRRRVDEALGLPLPEQGDDVLMTRVKLSPDIQCRLATVMEAHGIGSIREAAYRAMLVGLGALEEDAEYVSRVRSRKKINGDARVLSEPEINHIRSEGFGATRRQRTRELSVAVLPFDGGPVPVAYTERKQPVYVLDRDIPDDIRPRGNRRGIGTPDPLGPFATWLRDIYGKNVCVIVKQGVHSRIFKIGMGGDVFPISARSIEVEARRKLVAQGLLNKWK